VSFYVSTGTFVLHFPFGVTIYLGIGIYTSAIMGYLGIGIYTSVIKCYLGIGIYTSVINQLFHHI
jgi:hypothetical protein